jgi:HAD superfamily hydrolase (TIGR01509 family)
MRGPIVTGVILFDLDGTLVDADHLHYEAWRRSVAPVGIDLTVDQYRNEIMGFPNDMIMRRLLPTLDGGEAIRLIEGKEAMFRSLATKLEPAHGLGEFLVWLEERGTPVGVVTNAPRLNAEQELAGIGYADHFAALVIGDELDHSKPHPLPYLTGLEKLGGSARKSLAFEDSLSGIRSAKGAGLMVVGLTTGLSAERLLEEGAELAVPHFADPRLKAFVAARLDGLIG